MSSALPCIEIVSAVSTDAYREDPVGVSQPAFSIIKNAEGAIKIYHGLQSEEAKGVYLYVVWETLDHHRKFQADATEYPKLIEKTSSIWGAAPRILHVHPTTDPYAALAAPVTELALLTIKPGQSKEALLDIVKKLTTDGTPGEKGFVSAVYGTVAESDDTIALIAGWESVEAHWKLVTTDPEAVALLTQMRSIATPEIAHAALREVN
ncbi:hypothetical protein OBBRIDRAFT_40125 [Obba rivulosa]|uniref:ABM domain-containing protein n=1 Tax=Obba rivulosa TaxID=1052685 RepID=A0A8E2AQI7_9APHY|nr:hypothetical protein OBBRIDRAFT_40125 [Obba rivulosa]